MALVGEKSYTVKEVIESFTKKKKQKDTKAVKKELKKIFDESGCI